MAKSAKATAQQATATIHTAFGQLEGQTEELKVKLAEWHDVESRVHANLANVPYVVKLNVGGTTFQTAKETLLRVKGSYFEALLGSGRWNPDSIGGAYFLDLDPVIFRRVLLFLRTGDVSTEGLTALERQEFTNMMEYLKLTQCPTPAICQWDPDKSRGPGLKFSRDLRTVEVDTMTGYYIVVIAKKPLMDRFRVRVDHFFEACCISVVPMALKGCVPSLSELYRYSSRGLVEKFNEASRYAAPKIRHGDVVTIHRKHAHVEFALNEQAPTVVELDDPSKELFPCVTFWQGKMTILD